MTNVAAAAANETNGDPKREILGALGATANVWIGVAGVGTDLELLACALSHRLLNEHATADVESPEVVPAILRIASRAHALSGYVEDLEEKNQAMTKRVEELEAQVSELQAEVVIDEVERLDRDRRAAGAHSTKARKSARGGAR